MPARDQKTLAQSINELERFSDFQNSLHIKREFLLNEKRSAAVIQPIMPSGQSATANNLNLPVHHGTTSPRLSRLSFLNMFPTRKSHSGASSSSGETSANTSAPSSVVSQPVTPLSSSLNGTPDFAGNLVVRSNSFGVRRTFCEERDARCDEHITPRDRYAYECIVEKRDEPSSKRSSAHESETGTGS